MIYTFVHYKYICILFVQNFQTYILKMSNVNNSFVQ